MTFIIILFGALTFLAGLIMLFDPEIVFAPIRNNYGKIKLHILAVMIRLILGALLIHQSDISNYPLTIEILGWLSIVAALFFAVIGRKNFSRLIAWALSFTKRLGRLSGIFATAFGAFLIFAFY